MGAKPYRRNRHPWMTQGWSRKQHKTQQQLAKAAAALDIDAAKQLAAQQAFVQEFNMRAYDLVIFLEDCQQEVLEGIYS